MARRSESENSPPHGKISSSMIRLISRCKKTVARHLPIDTSRNYEDSSGLSCGPSNEIPRNRDTWTQLRQTPTGNCGRRTRVGGGESYQFPTTRTTQEASVPRSMERVPTIRRLLGSRVGSLRSRPDRRLLRHTLSRP